MADRATVLRELHEAEPILVLANVWDVASARAIAAVDGVRALATASHSIAAAHGYEDGENIPLDLHLTAVERVTASTDLPVSMDFESGYGDPGETTRRALAAGAVGANLEDGMRPLDQAVAAVEAVVAAREAEGTGFVLNARTDAFLVAAEPDVETVAEAAKRGRAFLEAGAECVFVPRVSQVAHIEALVSELGRRKLSVIGMPGVPPAAELERLGVARVSMGPWSYRVALTALQDAAAQMLAGGALPDGVRADSLP
jgi:2-methylisocitrate lyase-like PEP mutase family enzyme